MDETGKLSQRARDARSKALQAKRVEPIRSAARARLARRSIDAERAEAVAKAVRVEQRRLRKRQVEVVKKDVANHAGTPQTRYNHERKRPDALLRAHLRGDITDDQLAFAHEIAMVASWIERDVAVATASLETRIDVSRFNDPDIVEGLRRVRYQWAYTQWRLSLPFPKQLVLDMIVGDPIPYSTAARRHQTRHQTAKARLLRSLDAWPEFLRASLTIKSEDVDRVHARLSETQ